MAFNIAFTAEMSIKMLAGGLWRGRFGYFRHKWNYLDFGLVLLGWVSVVLWLTLPVDTAYTPLPPMPTTPPTDFPSPFPTDTFSPETFSPDAFPPDALTPLTFAPDTIPPESTDILFPTVEPVVAPFTPVSDDATPQPSTTVQNDPPFTPPTTTASVTDGESIGDNAPNTMDPPNRRRVSEMDDTSFPRNNDEATLDPTLLDWLGSTNSPPDNPDAFPADSPDATFPEFPTEPTRLPDVATLSPDTDVTPSYLTADFTAPAMAKNLASLFRLLRVFKVLRGIRLSKHAQALVLSLFESMRLLVNVIELLLVLFVLFAIAGVSLFQGALHQQCDNEYVTDGYLNVDTNGFLVSGNGFRCSTNPDVGRACMADGVCVLNLTDDRLNKNPNFGFTSFDNVGLGLLSVIEIASLSDWGSTMWNLAEARGLVVGLYFLVVIPVGGYFVVNLVIAVVHNAYTRKWKDIRDEFVSAKRKQKRLQAQKRKRRPSIIDMVVVKPLPATKLSHLELKTLATRFSSVDGRVKYKNFIEFFSPGVSHTVQSLREFLQSAKAAGLHSRSIFRFIDKDNSGDLSRDELVFGFQHAEGRVAAIFHEFDPNDTGTISMSQFRSALARIGFSGSGIKYLSRDDTLRLSMRSLDSFQSTAPLALFYITWRRRLARCIVHPVFTAVVNAALVVQLVCFNLKSFDPVEIAVNAALEAHLVTAQDVVAYTLGMEMMVKLTALGGRGYLVDKYNRFDGVLAIVGYYERSEMLVEVACRHDARVPVGMINIMFTCRVLRLLHLFRQWPNFRVLLETMLASFRGLLHFVFLLCVAMYIFALIGKHLFGSQMTDDHGFPTPFYATFDTVWTALLTVFQVFSGDAWTDVLYACMRVHAATGAVYVVLMFFTGNYLVVNIFLSILLQDFESDENEHHRSYFSTIADADIAHYYDVVVHWVTDFLDRYAPSSANRISSPRQQTKRRLRLKVQPMFSKLSSSMEPSPSTHLDELNRLHEIADIVLFKLDTHTIEAGPRQYFECFHGYEAIRFLMASGFCGTVAEAEALGNRLIELERFKCEASSIGRQADFDLQALFHATDPRNLPDPNEGDEDEAEDAVLGILDDVVTAVTTSQGVRFGPSGPFGNHTGVFSVHSSPWRDNIHAALEDAKEAHRRRDDVAASARDAKSLKFMVGKSLFVFGPRSGLRRVAKRVLMHQWFKYVVLVVVLTSCVMSALEISDMAHASLYLWADVVVTSLFFVEMALKIVAQGFIFTGRYAYMRNGWNVLDFVVAVTSVLAVVFTFVLMHTTPPCDVAVDDTCPASVDVKSDRVVKIFRLFRALRPLRAIHLNPGMKVVVKAILITIPCVLNLVVILTIFLFMFAVVTVHLLAGKLWYCQGNAEDKYTLNATACVSDSVTTRIWGPLTTSFDNIPNATLQLMEISTVQGWSSVMHMAMDAPSVGFASLHPIRNNTPEMALVFVSFVVICGFFMMGLFLGVIVYKFQQLKAEQNGTLFITEDQQKWVATQRRLFALKPKPAPSNKQLRGVRKRVFNVVVHPIFQGTKRVLILASVIVLAMDHYPSTPRFDSAYTQVLWFFTGVNVAEAALVLYAHGLKTYVRQNWVDAIAVVVSVMDSFPHLRVLRILRLNSHSMVSILKTLTMSLPALLNVASLLLLFAFVYAILGMNLFYDPDNPLYGECIRDVVNFDSLTSTMMVLFVVVTVL
ncbi:hypothetical protein DYB25_001932 [Aphanomyces astaci]|uniref:EF-hand domain-containing protein n=4 Tax=Aphanomyces astaci TaxID=112090 RepID=A0A397BM67_APHAT|nr:hypothetical protein DYB25_001932 [Aphanomyces astaci]